MKISKITILFWACMTLCSLETFSQCNVKVRDGGDQIALDASTELLYSNEDLENGLFSVRGSNSLFYSKTDKTIHVKHMVGIFVG